MKLKDYRAPQTQKALATEGGKGFITRRPEDLGSQTLAELRFNHLSYKYRAIKLNAMDSKS